MTAKAFLGHPLLYTALAALVVICGLYLFLPVTFPPHTRYFSRLGSDPDATTLISTLLVIYTFFAAAYGALAPSLVGRKDRVCLRAAALIYMFLALLLDLVRVWNSMGDLYATTMRHLSPAKVHDAAAEFTRYLIVNAFVLLFVLAVAFWPMRNGSSKDGKSTT
jgi:hypothetical protein